MPAKSRDHNLASAGIGHLAWLPIAHDVEQVALPQRSEVTCDDALGDLRVVLFAGGPRSRRVECLKSGSMAMRHLHKRRDLHELLAASFVDGPTRLARKLLLHTRCFFSLTLRTTAFRGKVQVACSPSSILLQVTLPLGFRAFGPCMKRMCNWTRTKGKNTRDRFAFQEKRRRFLRFPDLIHAQARARH